MTNLSLLQQAFNSVIHGWNNRPSSEQIVEALLIAEKNAKKEKINYDFSQLIGNWRLCFITGTKKSRQRTGIVLGAGRYVPQFVTIKICYSQDKIENNVSLAGLQLCLSGPVKFLPPKNILAFDFTRMNVKLFNINLYSGFIRGGELSEQEFAEKTIGKQAFFTYFLVENNLIAARGKGGGLALWGRV